MILLILINSQLIVAIIFALIVPGVFIFGLLFAVLMAAINYVRPPQKVQIRRSDAIL